MGMALPLLFVPNTIVGSLAYIMIPTLSQLNPNNPQMSQQINGAIKISTLVACAFVPAFYVMGQHSGLFLFNNLTTGQFLQSSAWLLIPIALESITSSMLNALDLESRGFFNYCLGSAILFVVMFCFANKFSLQVFSIAFGLALTISTILDIISIQRKTKIKLTFVYPMTICLAMVVPTIAFTSNIYNFLGALTESRLLQFVRLATTGISSVCFYIGIIYILDSIGVSTIIATKKTCKKLAKKPKIV
jgi:O-antigen/teichoic acid export membrane protein